jgi:uncharacterized protein (TIGR02453 family)
MAFTGFPPDYFAFFAELRENNNRGWFEENKARFKESVQEPLSSFVEEMAPRLRKISPHFVADPRPNGGTIFRIHRDMRFAKDKRPYKQHGAVQFRHTQAKDAHAPGFYVHIAPDEVMCGGGVWAPGREALRKIREAISAYVDDWTALKSDSGFVDTFGEIRGDRLERPPRGFLRDHIHIEDMKLKSFVAMAHATPKRAMTPDFADDVEKAMTDARPLMRFLCNALNLAF